MPSEERARKSGDGARLACPFCGSYEVGRLYLGSVHLDSCECRGCAARWDEDVASGAFRGRVETALLQAGEPRRRAPHG